MEGDTPSFLGLLDNGLNAPEHPDWGGWGGRYERITPPLRRWHGSPEIRPIWSDAEDEVLGHDGQWPTSNKATVWRWRTAVQNDFAARMDWTQRPPEQANHPPAARLDHPAALTAHSGDIVQLAATTSSDPDGDALSFEWFCYIEAATLVLADDRSGQPLAIKDADKARAWFVAPHLAPGAEGGSLHVVLAVTDHGSPSLTRYRRVIVRVLPQ